MNALNNIKSRLTRKNDARIQRTGKTQCYVCINGIIMPVL